ncbi:MAG: vitamin B12/bleomycin/antimicrobial peptide transport system ATP-binding/permease protein [Hyphomicrobiales bacterium]|nr:vitamin B12/bleomycin/antimicrobial peptide transport system ATP-binding/permease protein [Hyphomicrobiales bacterium]
MTRFLSTLATIWRLAIPYFRSEDRWPGRALLASVLAIELAVVAVTVLINQWNARFYNALQDRNWDSFVKELMIFCALAAAFIVLRVYQLYLNQWLQIRWRRWMTAQYVGHWLDGANHYRMQMLGDAADNPDQRIAEDIKQFIELGLFVGVGLLGSIVSLASFVVILWGLSAAAPLTIYGVAWNIPGYLVWAALGYAAIGTLLTHLIGRPLIPLNFNQQRYEADFRFNLVRVRENSEQIALLRGETAERGRLMERFRAVVNNWLLIMTRQKRLTFLTAGYNQASVVFPIIVVSPAYFAGHIQLGALTQTAGAFNSVQSALSFFVDTYVRIAEWRAVIERLAGFQTSIASAQAATSRKPNIAVTVAPAKDLRLDGVEVTLPSGKLLVAADGVTIAPHDQVLVRGPSGSGKSTLFRAIAGIWPFGKGKVTVPEGAKAMTLPQRPYLPIGTLSAAIGYPAEPGAFDAARIQELLTAVGLPAMAERLDEQAHWNRMLSLGEQQRLGIARALLHAPDFLFLDEATASLDEPAEAALYKLLQERLPNATIVSIGHRSTLAAFHKRGLNLEREGDVFRVKEAALGAAAS